MIFTIRAGTINARSIVVSTEDPIEALQSLKDFRSASLFAAIYDELGRPIERSELERFIEDEMKDKRCS